MPDHEQTTARTYRITDRWRQADRGTYRAASAVEAYREMLRDVDNLAAERDLIDGAGVSGPVSGPELLALLRDRAGLEIVEVAR